MADTAAPAVPRRVLVVCTHAPGAGFAARESIDLALGFAAFDQEVSLLFTGEGLRCLHAPACADQDTDGIAALLEVMPDYGISRFFVADEDLRRDPGAVTARAVPLEVVSAAEITQLIAWHDIVLRC